MSGVDLPRLPEVAFTYDYLPFGARRELVAHCPVCRRLQRTGLLLGEQVSEQVINLIKDRLQRYHSCTTSAFTALAEMEGIEAVMRAFGFPSGLMPEPSRSSHRPNASRSRDERTA